MNYYYLVASLPMLSPGKVPALGEDAFMALCREHLVPADQSAVEALLLRRGEGCGHPFVVAWRDGERRLRNDIVRLRADRRGVEASLYTRPVEGFDVAMLRAVEEAFGRATPAERELELDRVRWQMIEGLAGLDMFSAESVMAYALKLNIAHRWARLSAETGQQRLEEWVTKAATTSP
jgi:hypothetical protein